MRIGIIGTGRIASRFADTAFAGIESAYVSCVYNPKAESAEKFAIQHRIENYTDSLEELTMLTDAVYIASLHETHYEYAKYMLNNKKHVLCEKPAVLKKAQAEELYSLAKENIYGSCKDCLLSGISCHDGSCKEWKNRKNHRC